MAYVETQASSTGVLSRAPSGGLVLGAIASVQFGAALATHLFDRLGPAGTVLLRVATASIVLVAIWTPRVRGRPRSELVLAAVFGLVLAGMNLAFYESIDRIPLGTAVTIEFVGPLTVAVVGSRRPLDLLWVALALAGILALTQGGTHSLDSLGVALALIAGGLWGAYIILNGRVGRAYERGTGVALSMCIASVALLPAGIASGGSHLLEPESLAIGAAVGVLSSAIPDSFEQEALRRIAASVFGVLMSLEPGVAALAGFILLGQSLSAREIVGIALVVAASAGASRRIGDAPIDA
ncbi:MAG: EamA family transporter [Solirubrobacteraceae bacterium]